MLAFRIIFQTKINGLLQSVCANLSVGKVAKCFATIKRLLHWHKHTPQFCPLGFWSQLVEVVLPSSSSPTSRASLLVSSIHNQNADDLHKTRKACKFKQLFYLLQPSLSDVFVHLPWRLAACQRPPWGAQEWLPSLIRTNLSGQQARRNSKQNQILRQYRAFLRSVLNKRLILQG